MKTIRQCKTCPWRKGADVANIPGYDSAKHEALRPSIDQPVSDVIRIMGCHYSGPGPRQQRPCAGWINNQYQGGNSAVQVHVRLGLLPTVTVVGPQRATFDETFGGDDA